MQVTHDQEQFLTQIARHNIRYQTQHWALGVFPLQPDQIEPYTRDPDGFAADQLGVSREHLLAWGDFAESSKCMGTTRGNERCKAFAPNGYRVNSPTQFVVINPDCYCATHSPVRGRLFRPI